MKRWNRGRGRGRGRGLLEPQQIKYHRQINSPFRVKQEKLTSNNKCRIISTLYFIWSAQSILCPQQHGDSNSYGAVFYIKPPESMSFIYFAVDRKDFCIWTNSSSVRDLTPDWAGVGVGVGVGRG